MITILVGLIIIGCLIVAVLAGCVACIWVVDQIQLLNHKRWMKINHHPIQIGLTSGWHTKNARPLIEE